MYLKKMIAYDLRKYWGHREEPACIPPASNLTRESDARLTQDLRATYERLTSDLREKRTSDRKGENAYIGRYAR